MVALTASERAKCLRSDGRWFGGGLGASGFSTGWLAGVVAAGGRVREPNARIAL